MVVKFKRAFEKTPNKRPVFWLIGLLVPICIHLWTVNRIAVNMPYMDDYTFLVDAIQFTKGEGTFREWMAILLAPHGPHREHMIVFGRFAAILDYLIEGELNFRTMFFVGNVTLISTVLLLIHMARRAGLSGWQCVPVALLVFQPQYYESTMTWAICALQHLPALFFAFLSFYLLSRPSRVAVLFSFPTALVAVFSNGNGMAVLIAGFFMLLIAGSPKRIWAWVVFALVTFSLSRYIAFLNGTSSDLTNLLHPLRVLGGFFLLSGSMGVLFTRSLIGLSLLGILIQVVLAAVIGLLVFRLTDIRQWAGFARATPGWLKPIMARVEKSVDTVSAPVGRDGVLPLLGCCAYVLITLLGIAFARSNGWHYGLLLPRFIWFATVLMAVGYLLFIIVLPRLYRPRLTAVVLVLSLSFNGLSYRYTLDEVTTIHKSLLSDLHNWRENKLLITMPPGDPQYDQYYSLIIRDAVRNGVYHLPQPDYEPLLTRPSIVVSNQLRLVKAESAFKFVEREHYKLMLDSTQLLTSMDNACLLLHSDQHTFVWPIDQSSSKLAYYLMNGKSQSTGDVVTIFSELLPAASYRLGMLYKKDNHWQAVYTRESIAIRHRISSSPTGPLYMSEGPGSGPVTVQ